MKSRAPLFVLFVLVLLALGGIFFFYSQPDQEPAQVFPATVNRDCAPWDGGAFTIAIQYDAVTTITVSIWKSPDIKLPSTFELPDDEGQVGNASLLTETGPYVQLSGEVFFQSVSMEKPLEGRFSFKSERGEVYEGQFIAEWGNLVVYCG